MRVAIDFEHYKPSDPVAIISTAGRKLAWLDILSEDHAGRDFLTMWFKDTESIDTLISALEGLKSEMRAKWSREL